MIKRYVCAVMRGRIHLDTYEILRLMQSTPNGFGCEMNIFSQIVFYFCSILVKNAKKCKKMQKNDRKICVYEKFVVILHRNLKNKPNYKPNKPKKL